MCQPPAGGVEAVTLKRGMQCHGGGSEEESLFSEIDARRRESAGDVDKKDGHRRRSGPSAKIEYSDLSRGKIGDSIGEKRTAERGQSESSTSSERGASAPLSLFCIRFFLPEFPQPELTTASNTFSQLARTASLCSVSAGSGIRVSRPSSANICPWRWYSR